MQRRRLAEALGFAILALVPSVPSLAQPAEVTGVAMGDAATLEWNVVAGADDYNVYRGLLSWLASGDPARCHGDEVAGTSFPTPAAPPVGQGFYYLVTAENGLGEGTPGQDSGAAERDLLGSCDTVLRNAMLDRLGGGWSEWDRDRIAALGLQGYINEQLTPATIDESTNTDLNDRRLFIDPPVNFVQLAQLDIVNGVYARRQLEQQAARFFFNHFNTDHIGPLVYFIGLFPPCGQPPVPWCDPDYPSIAYRHAAKTQHDEIEGFRDLAFNGTFREMVELSALSPAMIYYLNTATNIAVEPNENYARELLELHTMGVDRGYSQADIEQLARVFTGWEVCRKLDPNLGPLDPCQAFYWQEGVPGDWVANFNVANHDCQSKTLFVGTAYETVIPDTCDGGGQPTAAGADDVDLALDAIVGHPSTPEFLATKLIQKFVTETPTQQQIDTVVAAWNDAGNPWGVGDVREVLQAVLGLPAFLDPDLVRTKIKTPVEHAVSAFRATRGKTDGATTVLDYLIRMQEFPYFNAVPTGYSEIGADWLDTNNLLERQNLVLDFTRNDPASVPEFAADVIGLLNANGVSTAPGNAAAIVEFFIDALYGGALTDGERQAAIDFLSTDDNGAPGAYDDARIRETVGFLLGYGQFQEQ